jgi:hypothetical protein
MDGGGGHGVTGGAPEGSGSALAVAGVEIGVDAVEEIMATAEVVIWVRGRPCPGVRWVDYLLRSGCRCGDLVHSARA